MEQVQLIDIKYYNHFMSAESDKNDNIQVSDYISMYDNYIIRVLKLHVCLKQYSLHAKANEQEHRLLLVKANDTGTKTRRSHG